MWATIILTKAELYLGQQQSQQRLIRSTLLIDLSGGFKLKITLAHGSLRFDPTERAEMTVSSNRPDLALAYNNKTNTNGRLHVEKSPTVCCWWSVVVVHVPTLMSL